MISKEQFDADLQKKFKKHKNTLQVKHGQIFSKK